MRLSIPLSVVTAALFAWPGLAVTTKLEVRDDGGFFKPETVAAANKIISDIKQEKKIDLLVETFLHVPKGKEKEAENQDTRAQFFSEWVGQRAREEQVNGIYLLICKEPTRLEVTTRNLTGKQFTEENRKHLENLLLAQFRNKKYDDGLLEGVRYVQSAPKDKNAVVGEHVHSGAGVHDAAGFFKPDAISKADEIIGAIKRDDKKNLIVETFLHAPEGKEQEAANPDTKADFFKEWADQRGRDQKVNGVLVLICKDPTYLKVVADNHTAKIFTEEHRNNLSKLMAARFKNKSYDDGLLDGVRYVQTALKGKATTEATDPAEAPPWPTKGGADTWPTRGGAGSVSPVWLGLGGLLCVGLVVLIAIGGALMVVMALFRAFHRGPAGYGPGGYGPAPPGGGYGGYGGGYGGGQGGGFLSSMLGGMFGGAAGGWAYDRFFGGHQAPNRGYSPREEGQQPQDPGYTSGGGGDFGGGGDTGGGADFGGGGDAGGGGDFGGGDTGGGDFGGGDTGGGGSF